MRRMRIVVQSVVLLHQAGLLVSLAVQILRSSQVHTLWMQGGGLKMYLQQQDLTWLMQRLMMQARL